MNAAGNAEVPVDARMGIYLQVTLALAAWFVLFSVLALFSGVGYARRWVYECAALSSLVMFVISVAIESITRRGTVFLATSSALLVVTYYARLLSILLSSRASIVILPLINIIRFDSLGSSFIALDLGQVGLYVLAYLIISVLRGSAYKTRELDHQGMR